MVTERTAVPDHWVRDIDDGAVAAVSTPLIVAGATLPGSEM